MQTSGWPLRCFFFPKLLLLISIELHGIDHVVWLINPSRTIDLSWEQHVQQATCSHHEAHTAVSLLQSAIPKGEYCLYMCLCSLPHHHLFPSRLCPIRELMHTSEIFPYSAILMSCEFIFSSLCTLLCHSSSFDFWRVCVCVCVLLSGCRLSPVVTSKGC